VTSFDVVKDIGPGIGSYQVVLSIHAYTFERAEEALGRGDFWKKLRKGKETLQRFIWL